MSVLSSILGKHHDPTPPAPRPAIGIVCHRLIDEDVAALEAMRVRFVRLSLYPPNGSADGGAAFIDRAVAEGLDVLAVNYRDDDQRNKDLLRWPSVQWQVGNEPDWMILTAEQAAHEAFAGDVTPGLGHGTPREWMRAYCDAYLPRFAPLAVHIYGEPSSGAVGPSLADAMAARGARDLWVTELGHTGAADLRTSLAAFTGTMVRRVYIYALWTEASDPYTITPAERDVITRYILGQ